MEEWEKDYDDMPTTLDTGYIKAHQDGVKAYKRRQKLKILDKIITFVSGSIVMITALVIFVIYIFISSFGSASRRYRYGNKIANEQVINIDALKEEGVLIDGR